MTSKIWKNITTHFFRQWMMLCTVDSLSCLRPVTLRLTSPGRWVRVVYSWFLWLCNNGLFSQYRHSWRLKGWMFFVVIKWLCWNQFQNHLHRWLASLLISKTKDFLNRLFDWIVSTIHEVVFLSFDELAILGLNPYAIWPKAYCTPICVVRQLQRRKCAVEKRTSLNGSRYKPVTAP